MTNSAKKLLVSVFVASFCCGEQASTLGLTTLQNFNGGTEMCLNGDFSAIPYEVDLDAFFYGSKDAVQYGESLGLNLADEGGKIMIESLSFVADVNTKQLPDYKAFMTSGILTYTDEYNKQVKRNFCDCVATQDDEYALVAGQDHVRTEYKLGSHSEPLNLCVDQDSNLKIEWTWCTASSIEMYDLKATSVDGRTWVINNGKFYSVAIEEHDIDELNDSQKSLWLTEDERAKYFGPGEVNAELKYQLPFKSDFAISSTYGEYRGGNEYHWGIDICSHGDMTVYAAMSGTVEYADWENPWDHYQGFGMYVKIVGDDGLWQYYGHMDEIYVNPGDRVEIGQPIGHEGSTGSSTGNHTHFEIRDNGTPIDCTEKLGIPNDYTMIYCEDYTPSESAEPAPSENEAEFNALSEMYNDPNLAVEALSFNRYFESSNLKANAMNLNDRGACSLGFIQFRASAAQGLLRAIKDADPAKYQEFVDKYPNQYDPYLNKDWSQHTIELGSDEYKMYTELLIQPYAVQVQWDYSLNFIKGILYEAMNHGIGDRDIAILYTRAYINAGPNSCSLAWLNNHTDCTLEEAEASFDNDTTPDHTDSVNLMHGDKVFDVLKNKSFEITKFEDLM